MKMKSLAATLVLCSCAVSASSATGSSEAAASGLAPAIRSLPGRAVNVVARMQDEPSTSLDAQVVHVGGRFGVFNAIDGRSKFVPARVVPLVEGQAYGWVIELRTDKKKVRWREEFTLPQAPETWGTPELLGTRRLSQDSKVLTTERLVEPVDGAIFNMWSVAKGDPAGKHLMRVFVEGRLVNTFEFEVR